MKIKAILISLSMTISAVLILIIKPFEMAYFKRVFGSFIGRESYVDMYVDFIFVVIAFVSLISFIYFAIVSTLKKRRERLDEC